jgi:hypothetical protein
MILVHRVCMVNHLPCPAIAPCNMALYTTVYSDGAAERQAREGRVAALNFNPMRRVCTASSDRARLRKFDCLRTKRHFLCASRENGICSTRFLEYAFITVAKPAGAIAATHGDVQTPYGG